MWRWFASLVLVSNFFLQRSQSYSCVLGSACSQGGQRIQSLLVDIFPQRVHLYSPFRVFPDTRTIYWSRSVTNFCLLWPFLQLGLPWQTKSLTHSIPNTTYPLFGLPDMQIAIRNLACPSCPMREGAPPEVNILVVNVCA